MKKPGTLWLALVLSLAASPAQAAPGGLLRVLLKGYWFCETQGDAVNPAVRQMQNSFRIIADSSYRTTAGQTGTYLLLGNDLTMTNGPFQGRRYILVGQGIMHPLDATGQRTTDRCVRQSGANRVPNEATDSEVAAPAN